MSHALVCVAVALAVALTGCATTSDNPHLGESTGASALDSDPFQQELDFDDLDHRRIHAAVFLATNEARKRHGREPVKPHPLLEAAARTYARKMVAEEFLSHQDPNDEDLRTPKDRLEAIGVSNALPAENLATAFGIQLGSGERFFVGSNREISRKPGGPPIPPHTYASFGRAVVRNWLDSPGHRRNLLSNDAVQLGVGAAFFLQNGVPAFVIVQKFQLYEPISED